MRDPKRIDKILSLVGGIWKQYPDLRLLQLLMNCTDSNEDAYYTEDELLVQLIKHQYGGKRIEHNKPKL